MPETPPPVDMRDPAFRDDPHPLLHALRAREVITRDVMGVWLACHHVDCSSGLRSTRLSREPWRSPVYDKVRPFLADSMLERLTEQWMLFNDPPKHTRLRRLCAVRPDGGAGAAAAGARDLRCARPAAG
jgi:cytochrome P450